MFTYAAALSQAVPEKRERDVGELKACDECNRQAIQTL